MASPAENDRTKDQHKFDRPAAAAPDGKPDEPAFQLEAPSLALPKGGGAIKGIDEKFTVNPSNGTLTVTLPLPLSPARNHTVPPVRIAYDAGAGNSVVGLGWTLDVPSIRRGTDRFIPRYDDGDVFLLSGADELVPSLSWDGAKWNEDVQHVGELTIRRYRPRVDGDFSRIERIARADGASWWRVTSRDNLVTFYGTDAGTRIDKPGTTDTYQWLPSIAFDDLGNCTIYEYKAEDLAGVPATAAEAHRHAGRAAFANRHLKRIRYANRVAYLRDDGAPYVPVPPTGDFCFDVVFDYGEHDPDHPQPDPAPGRTWAARDDAFSTYRAGFEIRTYRLLQRVLMFHTFDELNGATPTLVRSLDLTHAPSDPDAPEVTHLVAAQQSGYARKPDDSYSRRSLPALQLDYTAARLDTRVHTASPDVAATVPAGVTAPAQWIDLYGEGIAGVFSEHEGAWLYAANRGDVDEPGSLRLEPRRLVMPKPSFSGVGTGTLELQDLDADGSRQVVMRTPELEGYFELDGDDGASDWTPFRPFPTALRLPLTDRHVQKLDLVGDGRTDILVFEDDALLWHRCTGRDGYEPARRTPRTFDDDRGPEVVFAEPCQAVLLGDMTGDGLSDIVRIRHDDISYWPNLGYGRFGARVAMDDAPLLDDPERFDARHVRLADVTGTGTSDVLYLGHDGIDASINLSGNGWSAKQRVADLPTAPPVDVAATDLFGTGTTCLVWSSSLPADRDAPLRYVDLMGGTKPHLLAGYDTGLGRQVTFEHRSSTWHYLKDKSEGLAWATRLPFPVQTVSRVEVHDSVAGATQVSTYRYHHGHYDHVEREFRGFGRVDQLDAEDFEHWVLGQNDAAVDATLHQPPVLTRTWFHTGADGLPARLRDEFWDRALQRAGFADPQADEPALPPDRVVAAATADPQIDSPPRPEHRRQALRACRGTVLRQEVFGLDGDDRRRQLSPYSVTTHNCVIELLQPADGDRFAAITVKESERLTFTYERDVDDPRVEHRLNIAVDEHGNVTEAATVAYARRTPDAVLPQAVRAVQARTTITYTNNELTNDVADNAHYRLRRPSRTSTYELTGLDAAGDLYALADFEDILTTSTEIPAFEDDTLPPPGTVHRRLLGRKETLFYDATLLAAAPLHTLERHALPYESYELAFTADLITDVYATKVTDAVMTEGGYVHRGDGDWWVPSGRWEFLEAGETPPDAEGRFFAYVAQTDPFGARTTLGYLGDTFMLQDRVTDAADNATRVAEYDLRALSPRRIVDPNDNVSEVLLDELGWVKATALHGKGAEADDLGALTEYATAADDANVAALFAAPTASATLAAGADLLGSASARFVCDAEAFPPVYVTIVREQHGAADSPVQVSFEYSNGSGRVEMTKVPAEPADGDSEPRWLGTGRKVLNNKGNVVKEYEPFFSTTPAFEDDEALVASGVTRVSTYDPIGRLVRLDQPDGTFSTTEPGPWSVVERDRNDTILQSRWHDERVNRTIDAQLIAAGKDPVREAAAATQTEAHADTPFSRHLDPLGRPVLEVAHAGLDAGDQPILHRTVYRRDLGGRPLQVTDPREITTITYRYNLRGTLVAYDSADSGARLMLTTVMGEPLRSWDARGHEIRFSYDDPLHRLTAKRVVGGDGSQPLDHVFERIAYGEGRPNDKDDNLRTRIALHYDTAGRTAQSAFDFKGNLLAASRRFATDYRAVADWAGGNPDAKLDAESFASSCEYDALDRVTRRTAADGSVHELTYNIGNLLEAVRVIQGAVSELIVKDIDYDERGQRRRIVLGNDVTTEYVHDRETFRLLRLTSHTSGGTLLQDLRHTYDPVGNLTHLVDAAVPTVWFANAMVTGESTYTYDPLYRLTAATGREHAGQVAFGTHDNVDDAARRLRHDPNDVLAWQNYSEAYTYDAAGNIEQLAHTAPAGTGWTRDYTYADDSNRLQSTQVDGQTYTYSHHPQHGFIDGMPHLSVMRHTFRDELAATATQVVNSGTPETTFYVYDGDGRRVRKITERAAAQGAQPTVRFERVTLDGCERDREYDTAGTVTAERHTLHVMDDQERVALIERDVDPAGGAVTQRLVRYQGADLLGSARLETDASGAVIGYELYHPFGTTAYQAVEKSIVAAAKRFRYTGMERDEESGLEYHNARYYVPWLGRWTAPDTHADELDGNRYAYVKNNPVVHRDRNGLFEEPVHGVTTYRLALAAGFTKEDAAKIAIATAGMDHDEATRPGDGIGEMQAQIWRGRTQEYHYPTQEAALDRINSDIKGGVKDLEEFGRHLHSLEDVGFKEAAGPHNRSKDRALSPVVGIIGAWALSGGVITIIETAKANFSTAANIALGVLAAVLIAFGLYATIFAFRAEGTGHPSYQTERGEWSDSFHHYADEAFQDPKANTEELRRIYAKLKEAAAKRSGGKAVADDAAAEAAIKDVVTADDACQINNLINTPTADTTGNPAPSYADIVKKLGRWAPDKIDVSLDRGREFTYRPGIQVCPVPAR